MWDLATEIPSNRDGTLHCKINTIYNVPLEDRVQPTNNGNFYELSDFLGELRHMQAGVDVNRRSKEPLEHLRVKIQLDGLFPAYAIGRWPM